MSTRYKELLTVALVFAASVVYYVGRKEAGWFGLVKLSPTLSLIIILLLGLSLVYILIRTIH